MILRVEINNRTYKIDWENPLDIAIPLVFNGAQPNAYDVEPATAKACEAGEIVGDTRRGGSCNFEQIKLIPHCNGTHTESVGHITDERISVHECLQDAFIPAQIVSVKPEKAAESNETYAIDLAETDEIITEKILRYALENVDENWLDALIIRTLPNNETKKSQTYLETIPPFFTTEAMRFIVGKNIKHLLVDLPSIDRLFDEGKLSNHRIFWNVAPENRELNDASFINRTITELIFVADEIADGAYLLNLQIAAFQTDAAPSRPKIFKLDA